MKTLAVVKKLLYLHIGHTTLSPVLVGSGDEIVCYVKAILHLLDVISIDVLYITPRFHRSTKNDDRLWPQNYPISSVLAYFGMS